MTDSWRDRILEELSSLREGYNELSAQNAQARQTHARDGQNLTHELGAGDLLDPFRRGSGDGGGQQADALARRMGQDGDMPYFDPGSSSIYSANVLLDPLMETLLGSGTVTVGTSWTAVGGEWEARVRNVSGSNPVVTARRTHRRKLMEGHIYRTDILLLDSDYAGTGEAWVELRPKSSTPAPVHIDWPWCVVCCRVYVDKAVRAWTNLDESDPDDYADEDESDPSESINYVRMAMVNDELDYDDPDETGDETDLQELSDDKMESQVYVGTEDIDKTHHWMLQIHLKKSNAGAGGVAVAVAEPQVNYTYQEAPMPFDPLLGNYDTIPGSVSGPSECEYTPAPDGGGFASTVGWQAGQTRTYDVNHVGTDNPFTFNEVTGDHNTNVYASAEAGISTFGNGNKPPNSPCGLVNTWLGHQDRECWWPIVIPTFPTDLDALAGFTFQLRWRNGSAEGQPNGGLCKVALGPPTALGSGIIIGVLPFNTTVDVVVPKWVIPAVGQTLWFGLTPNWRREAGGDHPYGPWYCSFNNPADSGQGTSGDLYIATNQADVFTWQNYAAGGPCPPHDGATFEQWPVGLGDGSQDTYNGWPTQPGTSRWYVDGLLTEPLTYDDATGIVVFDRNVAVGAPVRQSGAGPAS